MTPEDFSGWLLEDQLAHLSEQLTQQTFSSLLSLCAGALDTAPLLHLVTLARDRELDLTPLGPFLLTLRPSTLQAVSGLEGLWAPAAQAWETAEPEHLLHFCLLDRYLRRHRPQLWREKMDGVREAVASRLEADEPADADLLMRLEGEEHQRLRRLYPNLTKWDKVWRETARDAIQLLAERPRGVSQANAERLLAQQVYTDPGHFLLELLQNADDAGASEFTVDFGREQLTVTHNGAPFDFRDLVGILSIGQTTKKISQIGFFGVGFKSIYEVTDRPRLRSGHLNFEIADISVPRPLANSEYSESTELVLPLKNGLDWRPFWDKALAIEAALLLNVPNLRTLRWRNENGEDVHLSVEHLQDDSYRLRQGDSDQEYLVWKGEYEHYGPRPTGKPTRAHLHLALPAAGLPPLAPSLYSFLPIAEPSGLRFITGSHFDVPVDRERLDIGSSWNQGIVNSITTLVAEKLSQSPELGWQVLKMLPLSTDPLGPLFLELPQALAVALRGIPLARTRQGEPCRADEAWLLDADLEPLFAGLEGGPLVVQDERRREWLTRLGAPLYDLSALIEAMQGGERPGHLAGEAPGPWIHTHHLLGRQPDTVEWRELLRTLPILLDQDLQTVAPQDVHLMGPQWLGLFKEEPRTVHPSLQNPTTASLLAQLDVPLFQWEHLVSYLRDNGPDNLHLERLYQHLTKAPRPLALAALESPICLDQKGEQGRLVPLSIHYLGIVAAHSSVPAELFPKLRFLQSSPALEELLEGLNWPRFDLGQALALLAQEQIVLSKEQCETFVSVLLESTYSWTAEAIEALVSLPLFETTGETRLPLELMWLYRDQGLSRLLPGLPELCPDSASAKLVEKLGLSHHLNKADLDTLLAHLDETDPEESVRYLVAQADSLSRYQTSQLFSRPLFDGYQIVYPDQEPGEDSRWVAEPDLARLFQGMGVPVLGSERARQIRPLLKAVGYPMLGLTQLMSRLSAQPPAADSLPELRDALIARSEELQLAYSDEHRQNLPIWSTRSGQVVPAAQLPPCQELAEMMGLESSLPDADNPEEFWTLFPLPKVEGYLEKILDREAKLGHPLSAQPSWCGSVEAVDKLSRYLKHSTLCVDTKGRLRDEPLLLAPTSAHPFLQRSRLADELLHPDSSQAQKDQSDRIAPSLLVQAYVDLEPSYDERLAFYQFLEESMPAVAADSAARELLETEPIWPTQKGSTKALEALILDPDFPDLGQDWHPHIEIPASLLERLQTVLGVGKPEPVSMLRDHLLPAYQKTRSESLRRQILQCMGRLSGDLEQATLRRTLRPPDGRGEFQLPAGHSLERDYHPPRELKSVPSIPPVSGESLPLLRRLGLPFLPAATALEVANLTHADGKALLDLVLWAWQQNREALEPLWSTLGELRWMPSRDQSLRSPKQLFIRGAELEDLIGDSPSLFPTRSLPVGLARQLGLKEADQVDASLVLDHFQSMIRADMRAPGRIYAYLESCLNEGRLSGAYLLERLKGLPWVWTDEREYRRPEQVLGVPAFRYFGSYRGTWEGVHHRFPGLATLFSIPDSVGSQSILGFLSEVKDKDYSPDLRRLLGSCLALLGEQGVSLNRDWRVLPARQLPEDCEVLVSASEVGVVRSNSPTLASIFAAKGRLYVVDSGDRESSAALENLYDELGIPHLRDAYTVKPDRNGRDVSEELGEAVAIFRQLLRAIWNVLPRLRAARPEWEDGVWLAETRLAKLTGSGSIKVIENLRLHYSFPGVAEVEVEAAAAFDPERRELLVNSHALTLPSMHAVQLAEGLLDCLYQGPGSEGLVDLLNLLIPLGDQHSMDEYLDRRHFPRPFDSDPERSALEDRLGELLDYGFHRRLERDFAELEGSDWELWRETDLSGMSAREAAEHLLQKLGLSEPAEEMVESLEEMLGTERLELMVSSEGPAPPRAHPQSVQPPAPAPAPAESLVAPPTPVAQPKAGGLARVKQTVLGKIGKWFGGTSPEGRPIIGLNTQLYDVAESYRNPPEKHLVVSTKALTGPDLYCMSALGVHFDPQNQLYHPASIHWPDSFVPSGRTVDFSGRLTFPDHTMPKPLYSRLTRPPKIRGSKGTLRGPDRYGEYRLKTGSEEAQIGYTVELCSHPDYQVSARLHDIDGKLLRPTASNEALPQLTREWIDWARTSGLLPWQLVDKAKDFVVSHYFYDLRFLERPEVQQVYERPLGVGENRFLSLLHAGPFGPYLGRGVCLEISTVLLEILRRVGVPSVLAQVWMLDEGLIHQPDHVVVMVLLQSARGPYWYPVDASTNRTIAHEPEEKTELARVDLLQKAADLILTPGLQFSQDPQQRERELEEALLSALEAPLLEALLHCMAKAGTYQRKLSPELQWLVDHGYLRVERESLFKVYPVV